MYLQIVEWVVKFVGLINDSTKLSDSLKRKQIGKDLVKVHEFISRITENAHLIEREISERVSTYNRNLPSLEKASPDWDWRVYLGSLRGLFELQKNELLRFEELLENNRSFLEIYGGEMYKHIRTLIERKLSLIKLIVFYAMGDFNKDKLYLPKTFDLMEIPSFNDRRFSDNYDYQHVIFFGSEDNLRIEITNLAQLIECYCNLLKYFRVLKSVELLQKCQEQLADIIRTNFEVEELF